MSCHAPRAASPALRRSRTPRYTPAAHTVSRTGLQMGVAVHLLCGLSAKLRPPFVLSHRPAPTCSYATHPRYAPPCTGLCCILQSLAFLPSSDQGSARSPICLDLDFEVNSGNWTWTWSPSPICRTLGWTWTSKSNSDRTCGLDLDFEVQLGSDFGLDLEFEVEDGSDFGLDLDLWTWTPPGSSCRAGSLRRSPGLPRPAQDSLPPHR
jgi:hypothetical protein